jgi:hypothetical protein
MIYSINSIPKTNCHTSIAKTSSDRKAISSFSQTESNQNVSFKSNNLKQLIIHLKQNAITAKNYAIWNLPKVDVVTKLKWMGHSTKFTEIQALVKEIEIFGGQKIKSGLEFNFKHDKEQIKVHLERFEVLIGSIKKQPHNLFELEIIKRGNSVETTIVGSLSKEKNIYSFGVMSNNTEIVGDYCGRKSGRKKDKTIPHLTKESFAECEKIIIDSLNLVLEELKK